MDNGVYGGAPAQEVYLTTKAMATWAAGAKL